MSGLPQQDLSVLAQSIKDWGKALGFAHVGIANIDVSAHQAALSHWLENHYHGEMGFMVQNQDLRLDPSKLHEGTVRVISVAMEYLPPDAAFARTLKQGGKAYISRYAMGRDYHKVLRKRLVKLADKIREQTPDLNCRPFVDSAPVLEHALAEKAGVGWTGKHSLTLNKQAGSWFFLGELFINLPLPVDTPVEEGCGSCVACINICPTDAIVEPYVVDARRCISYLTIENKGPIPEALRSKLGNRIYGCDDCQLICPWNRYANLSVEKDFYMRQQWRDADLLSLFAWDEATFLQQTEGSAIRRIGFERWQRNLAVALGNAPYDAEIVLALEAKLTNCSELVAEHIHWAIGQQQNKQADTPMADRLTQRLIRSVEKGLPRDA